MSGGGEPIEDFDVALAAHTLAMGAVLVTVDAVSWFLRTGRWSDCGINAISRNVLLVTDSRD